MPQYGYTNGVNLDPAAIEELIRRKNALSGSGKSRASSILEQIEQMRNRPQEMGMERSVDPALASSIAQASAQLGTIGGKTPSTAPVDQFAAVQEQRYNSSLADAAKRRNEENQFDQTRLKTAMFEDTLDANDRKLRAAEDRQAAMDMRQGERDLATQKDRDRNYELNNRRLNLAENKNGNSQDDFKKLPIESQIEIKKVADKTAIKNMMANLMAQQLKTMGDAIARGDKNQAIKAGQLMYKNLNSPDGGRDALQAPEEERIGGLLKFQKGNLTEPGEFLGRDIPGFYKMAAETVNGIRRSIADDKARMAQIRSGGYSVNADEINTEAPGFGSGPQSKHPPRIINNVEMIWDDVEQGYKKKGT